MGLHDCFPRVRPPLVSTRGSTIGPTDLFSTIDSMTGPMIGFADQLSSTGSMTGSHEVIRNWFPCLLGSMIGSLVMRRAESRHTAQDSQLMKRTRWYRPAGGMTSIPHTHKTTPPQRLRADWIETLDSKNSRTLLRLQWSPGTVWFHVKNTVHTTQHKTVEGNGI